MTTLRELAKLKKALTGSPFKLHYRTEFQGIPISVENRKGSKRQWGSKPEQHTVMEHPYGYVRGSMGYDGDEVDVYVGPDKTSDLVFIVNQRRRADLRKFDEHKVMLGFKTLPAAKRAYLAHMSLGEKMISSIRMWTIDRFKKWLERHGAKGGPARKSLSECGDLVFPELLMKAGGPYIGPRGGKWADPQHTIPWKEPAKQHLKSEKEVISDRLLAQIVDHSEADSAWQRMTEVLEQLDTDLKQWGSDLGTSGKVGRKAAGKRLAALKERTLAKIPTPKVIDVAGLTVETIASSIEQHTAEMIEEAFNWRERGLTEKDRGKYLWPGKDLRESFGFSGANKQEEYGQAFFNLGRRLKVWREANQPSEKNRAEWDAKWKRTVRLSLQDVAALPIAHRQLLKASKVRTRFLVHTSLSESSSAFVGGEATRDRRLGVDTILMYSWSGLGKDDPERGVSLTHEVGHIVERVVRRTLSNEKDWSSDTHRLSSLFSDQVGELQDSTRSRDTKEYGSQATTWMRSHSEWFAEAYRYAYRDGGDMQTTLKQGDFDHKEFRALVDRKIQEALTAGVRPTKNFQNAPTKVLKSLFLVPRGKLVTSMGTGKRGRAVMAYEPEEGMEKSGPYIGPRGGKWADPQHKVPWKEPSPRKYLPQVFYHSARKPLSEFRSGLFSVTDEEQVSRQYLESGAGYTHTVRIPTGLRLADDESVNQIAQRLAPGTPYSSAWEQVENIPGVLEALKSRGYEGIYISDVSPDNKLEHKTVTVFDPKASGLVVQGQKSVRARDAYDDMDLDELEEEVALEELEIPARIEGNEEAIRDWLREAVPLAKALLTKSLFFVPLEKAGPSGSGWHAIPGGKKGGMRRRRGKGYDYWYPDAKTANTSKPTFEWGPSKWTEADLAAGKFDRDPAHWHGYQKVKGQPPIGWTQGGVIPSSKHPVKEAGLPHRLYQIIKPTVDTGWARIRDLHSGEERLVEHSRVIPVYHDAKKRPPKPKEEPGEVWVPDDQPKPSGVSVKAVKIPAVEESRAKPGSALASMESGVFLRHTAREYETDESGNSVRVEVEKTHVDPETKTKLLAEFAPMLAKIAKMTKRRFALKSRYTSELGKRRVDETLAELRSSAMEGVLVAMERYEGGKPFSPLARAYAREYSRLHAAREFSGGIAIPNRHARLLSKYIAAKIEAAKQGGSHDPGPELVAKYWDIKKRDLHSDMERDDPQRPEAVPMGSYKLKVKVRSKSGKKVTLETDTKTQPGKLEWAGRMHSFLTGQATAQGSEFFEESSLVFPGVHMGAGLSTRERVEIRASIDKILPGLRTHEITIQRGIQSNTYHADSAAILERMLGLGDYEPQSAKQIAADLVIEKKTASGWKSLGHRQKETLIQTYLERALDRVRAELGEGRASTLIGRAKERLVPEEQVRPGPTWRQALTARARSVPTERIREWRKKERARLRGLRKRMLARVESMSVGKGRDHQEQLANGVTLALRRIGRMSNREVAFSVVQSDLGRATAQTRAMQVSTVDVDIQSPGYDYGWAVVTMTDPTTGRQRRARMRTISSISGTPAGQPLSKAVDDDEPLSAGVVQDMLRWPRLIALLYGRNGIYSSDRYTVEYMMGLH